MGHSQFDISGGTVISSASGGTAPIQAFSVEHSHSNLLSGTLSLRHLMWNTVISKVPKIGIQAFLVEQSHFNVLGGTRSFRHLMWNTVITKVPTMGSPAILEGHSHSNILGGTRSI